jgi:hypothetical protein
MQKKTVNLTEVKQIEEASGIIRGAPPSPPTRSRPDGGHMGVASRSGLPSGPVTSLLAAKKPELPPGHSFVLWWCVVLPSGWFCETQPLDLGNGSEKEKKPGPSKLFFVS